MDNVVPDKTIFECLRQLIDAPCLARARELEAELAKAGFGSRLIGGRQNQKSSIEAAGESDRPITERLANAFDASLTAARLLAGVANSDRTLTPRVAAQRFLNPSTDSCVWEPQYGAITFRKPIIQFWADNENERLRYRKYQASAGLVTVMVRDSATGISRSRMPETILNLNSEDKLKIWEAIGQFGHGGSSALSFCELCLILTQPRFEQVENKFYWTLIYQQPDQEASKQPLVCKWFCGDDGLPLVGDVSQVPALSGLLPGTSIWHFGYTRGDWLKRATHTHQDTPAGRLGRLFFSYPLPFEIHGELARGDTPDGKRTIKGSYYRLVDGRPTGKDIIEYRSGEKSEALRVEGLDYGTFSMFIFVFGGDRTAARDAIRSHIDQNHPVIMTLNGQNHGEMTSTLFADANLPELASSMIVEVRLDGLDQEALANIVSNSREVPKSSVFTKALKERVRVLLEEDETLAEMERRRQAERARQSSEELNTKITRFLASILSDATSEPGSGPGDGPGGRGGSGGTRPQRPEIPAKDPPRLLAFLEAEPIYVPEGTTKIAKFKSDARPPRYSFHGDNPRCFARVKCAGTRESQITISGKADIDGRGYGSITLCCADSPDSLVGEAELTGSLELTIQATDGSVLSAKIEIGVAPKPKERKRGKRPSVKPRIILCAPDETDRQQLARLLVTAEDKISPFGIRLEKYREAVSVDSERCAYWGDACIQDGGSVLTVEINVGHPAFVSLLASCASDDERVFVKEKVVQDIVLDCYQHAFRLSDVPELVHDQLFTEPNELTKAAEICLNYDKILRMAAQEKRSLTASA